VSPLLLLSLLACGGVPPTDIAGTVGGHTIGETATAYFGGPFMYFSDTAMDCMDVAFVTRYYDPDEIPTDLDHLGLQITFFDDDVLEGRFDLGGEAAVGASLLAIEGDDFEIYNARTGTLTVDELVERSEASGTLELDFGEDGSLTSDWAVEWCVNVSE